MSGGATESDGEHSAASEHSKPSTSSRPISCISTMASRWSYGSRAINCTASTTLWGQGAGPARGSAAGRCGDRDACVDVPAHSPRDPSIHVITARHRSGLGTGQETPRRCRCLLGPTHESHRPHEVFRPMELRTRAAPSVSVDFTTIRELLSAQLDQEATTDEAASANRHLGRCAAHRARSTQAGQVDQVLRIRPAEVVPDLATAGRPGRTSPRSHGRIGSESPSRQSPPQNWCWPR